MPDYQINKKKQGKEITKCNHSSKKRGGGRSGEVWSWSQIQWVFFTPPLSSYQGRLDRLYRLDLRIKGPPKGHKATRPRGQKAKRSKGIILTILLQFFKVTTLWNGCSHLLRYSSLPVYFLLLSLLLALQQEMANCLLPPGSCLLPPGSCIVPLGSCQEGDRTWRSSSLGTRLLAPAMLLTANMASWLWIRKRCQHPPPRVYQLLH